jgi:gliding motility-associated-like protein
MLPLPFSYIPQFYYSSGTFFSDKTKWYEISGSFVATNNSNYITIGNFKDDANTDSLFMGGGAGWVEAMLYIDDVSVYDCDALVFIAEAGSNQTICMDKNDSVQIGSTPRNEYIYWWLPATGLSNDSIANPKASPVVTTTYYLHQKDFKFDETIDSVTVFVKANCDTASDDIYIPNIFSPNGDLNNDVLYVRSHNIKTMDFNIYNRWGEKVFETKDINKGWDGRFNGGACNEGVFVWYLNATLKDDKTITKKGNVTLIR